MAHIRALIFDFGGVLVRTEDWSGRRKWEAQLGLAERVLDQTVFGSDTAARASRGELPASAVWAHVASALKLDPAQLEACRADFWAGDKLDVELIALIQSLRPRYRTAILSNAWSDARDNFARLFGLDKVFDLLIISAEEGIAKPDPRLYQIAVERLGVEPSEAVFVDDFIENVEAARAVGLHAIHYQPGLDVRAALEQAGVVMLPAAGGAAP